MCKHLPLDVDRPSTAHHGTNSTYKQPQLAPQIPVGDIESLRGRFEDSEKKQEVERIEVEEVMEVEAFVLPGMLVCINKT